MHHTIQNVSLMQSRTWRCSVVRSAVYPKNYDSETGVGDGGDGVVKTERQFFFSRRLMLPESQIFRRIALFSRATNSDQFSKASQGFRI